MPEPLFFATGLKKMWALGMKLYDCVSNHTVLFFRNTVYIITSVMVLLVVLMILTGLVLGMIGASTFDTPSTRGDLSDIGGRILIGLVKRILKLFD